MTTKLQIGELPALVLLDAEGLVAGQTLGVAKREEVLELLAGIE